jgi:hypothetical protein
MAENLAADAGQEGRLIFDFDIPCPHCEYNLRGLTVPRCPECGNAFDPHRVLHDFRETQPPLPILWVIRNVLRHPLNFWEMPEVRRSQGPLRVQLFFSLLYVPVVLAAISATVIGGPRRWRPDAVELIFTALGPGLLASLFLYMFVLIHGILCRAALLRSTAREGVRAAKEIVGYGLVWFGPVLLGFVAAARYVPAMLAPGSPIEEQLIAAAILCATAGCCVAWAVTIHQGARFVSGGSGVVATWCTVVNPFWYILVLAAIVSMR